MIIIYINFYLLLIIEFENRLRTLIRTETNSETKGQLEFLLNLLCKSGDQIIEQSSDNEQDNDDVCNILNVKKEKLCQCSRFGIQICGSPVIVLTQNILSEKSRADYSLFSKDNRSLEK